MRRTFAIACCLALAASGVADAATSREQRLERQVTTLKKKKANLKRANAELRTASEDLTETMAKVLAQRNDAWGSLDSARTERDTAIVERNTAVAQRDALTTENATLREQRDDALAGLPAAIRAVPLADFWRLVLTPARQTWTCNSYYESDGYWSLDFQASSFCS